MIELGHIATGATLAAACSRGPLDAFCAGMASHALFDITPHGEIGSKRFELWTTMLGLGILASRLGVRDKRVWAALGAVAPDIEHVLPRRLTPRRALFPTHRYAVLHSSDGTLAIPAWAQVIAGGATLGALVASVPAGASSGRAAADSSKGASRLSRSRKARSGGGAIRRVAATLSAASALVRFAGQVTR